MSTGQVMEQKGHYLDSLVSLALFVCMTLVVQRGTIACSGSVARDVSTAHGGSGASAGASGSSDAAAGGASGTAGAAGSRVISDEPMSCVTTEGAPGISVILLPYPGAQPTCVATHQPGAADSACPTDSFYRCDPIDCSEAQALAGCCRPDGNCGLLDQGFFSSSQPLGCISSRTWVEHAAFLGRTVAPVACGN